jgi:hypothetical protein
MVAGASDGVVVTGMSDGVVVAGVSVETGVCAEAGCKTIEGFIAIAVIPKASKVVFTNDLRTGLTIKIASKAK